MSAIDFTDFHDRFLTFSRVKNKKHKNLWKNEKLPIRQLHTVEESVVNTQKLAVWSGQGSGNSALKMRYYFDLTLKSSDDDS